MLEGVALELKSVDSCPKNHLYRKHFFFEFDWKFVNSSMK